MVVRRGSWLTRFAPTGSSVGTSDRAPDAIHVERCGDVNGTSAIIEFESLVFGADTPPGFIWGQPVLEVELAIRLGGALGSGARTGGIAGAEVIGCGADVKDLAATLPVLRAR